VDIVISTFIHKDTRTMNFRRALKMLQRLGLAVATTATIAIVAPAPSQATPPPQIITSIGSRRPLAVFEQSREIYIIGCPALQRAWDSSPQKSVDPLEYDRIVKRSGNTVVAKLICDGGLYQGYSSSAIPGGHLLIVKHSDGKQYQHYVTPNFFSALQVSPQKLTQQSAESILKQFPLVSNTEFKSGQAAIVLPPDCTKVNCDTKPTTPNKPSALFSVPNRIVTAPNFPAMAMFLVEDESYVFDPIGCPDIAALWKGIPSQAITSQEYGKLLQSPNFVGGFACNVPPGFNQGYTSAEIPGGNMLILQHRDGRRYRHYVNTGAFFTPLRIAPKQLSSPELEQILKDIPVGKTNFTTKP
jgi:hypothetical protein